MIQLTKGKEAIIDSRDQGWLSNYDWCVSIAPNKHIYYAVRKSRKGEGKRHYIWMHRIIWERHNGPIPKGMEIDHINRNSLDNRLENLRLCSRSQNLSNMSNQIRKSSLSSKFKGVCYDTNRQRWKAYIKQDGALLNIGRYHSEEEAARAYDAKAREMFGEFANVNFKED